MRTREAVCPTPSRFTLSSRPTPAMALSCRARWRRSARTSATLSCWSMTDALSDAVRSTSTLALGRDSFDYGGSREPSGGGGRRLVKALLAQAKNTKYLRVSVHAHSRILLTHGIHCRESPGLPDKIHKDCYKCPDCIAATRWDDPRKSAYVRNLAAAQELVEDQA